MVFSRNPAVFSIPHLLLFGSFLLSACGGGGGSATPPPTPPVNQAPTANAGLDQSINEGSTVNLSGAGTDGDGTIASYSWQQDSGTTVTITNANMANASFTAPNVTASEELIFRLTVTDDDGATASDTLAVTVNDVPPPVGTALDWDEGNWDEVTWQ